MASSPPSSRPRRRPTARTSSSRGGADIINQYLAAGLVDEIEVHVTPLILGGGERLFEGVGPDLKLEQLRAVEAPGVAHLKYRVVK